MSHRSPLRLFLLAFSAICFPIFASALPAPACQVLEQPEKVEPGQEHQQMHHGGHHMNIPMGEEKCDPKFTFGDGPTGPAHWGGTCSTGKMQSPIDIQNAQKLPIDNLKFLYQPAELDEINDCNQYRLLVRFPDNNWLRVGKKPYFLSEIHFKQPGENAVDGKRPRMSIQLVHLSTETAFVIIEIPVIAGKENPAFKAILEHVPAPGKENKVSGVKINVMDLLPADRSLYRYPGSLTMPPFCNEGATWYVMKNPIEFSEAQIAQYMKYYHDTARPLQPVNGRPVDESQ